MTLLFLWDCFITALQGCTLNTLNPPCSGLVAEASLNLFPAWLPGVLRQQQAAVVSHDCEQQTAFSGNDCCVLSKLFHALCSHSPLATCAERAINYQTESFKISGSANQLPNTVIRPSRHLLSKNNWMAKARTGRATTNHTDTLIAFNHNYSIWHKNPLFDII